ncbi:MAG: TerB family tellurite resistance protein [Myxococcales bacterium]|nr:TerB family tellurite resistance protein [Myxococcales bacterium]MCB9702365.1 TerB family tellurite resistance protein [Myxococcales bacterium]
MSLKPEQEWLLVGCGLIAHADEILDMGEWDAALRLIDETIDGEDRDTWREIIADQDALEERFARLPPLDQGHHLEVLHRCWKMALVDGGDSEIEETVHDRIARALGVSEAEAALLRERWTREAIERAELVAGLAAVFTNLDGHLDFQEAIHFDNILERLPLSMGRRLELSNLLHKPPRLDPLADKLASLDADDRLATLHQLVPLVAASQRGGRERDAFFELAGRAKVPLAEAERLLNHESGT